MYEYSTVHHCSQPSSDVGVAADKIGDNAAGGSLGVASDNRQ